MTKKERGYCVVVNVSEVKGQDRREGSDVDASLITSLFEQLHFKPVEIKKDLLTAEVCIILYITIMRKSPL